jgi:hypothetical protein
MMTNKFLKPATITNDAGEDVLAIVRDPDTMVPLAAGGEWKTISPFWTRRLRDKDVIDATDEATATPLPAPSLMPADKPKK